MINHLNDVQKAELLECLNLIDDPEKPQATCSTSRHLPGESTVKPALKRRRARKDEDEDEV